MKNACQVTDNKKNVDPQQSKDQTKDQAKDQAKDQTD